MDIRSAFVFIVLNVSFGIYCFIFLPSLMDRRRDWIIYGSTSVLLLLSLLQVGCLAFANYVAPNGKFMDTNAKPITLPNYLAWWTMEQPAFIIPTVSLVMHVKSGRPVPPTAFFLLFFILHYFQRAFIYPWLSRGRPYPIWPNYIGAIIFCTMNGSAQANDLLHGNYSQYLTMSDLLHPRVFIGIAVFFCGWILNLQADNILRNLRKPGEQSGYKIPYGGLFKYISSANHVAECIEWTGYALASGCLLPACFAIFSWLGIGMRAIKTHEFYLSKFGSKYPKDRKRLIPFVW